MGRRRRDWSRGWLALAIAAVSPALLAQPHGLQVENLTSPLGVDTPAPRLSWKIDGAMQSAYELRAATSVDLLGVADLWKTGRVDSGKSNNVNYSGPSLTARARVYWQVRVWTDRSPSEPSTWSAPAFWEMGLLDPNDWSAQWIGSAKTAGSVIFQREFSVASVPIQSARLYITGLGAYSATINNQPVSDDVLTPGETLQRVRLEYATLDVTRLLAQGPNTITVQLGNGPYSAFNSAGRYGDANGANPNGPGLRAQLEIVTPSGRQTIGTDGTWSVTDGPTTTSTWWGGEDYDARWQSPSWSPAQVTAPPFPSAVLSWRGAPGVRAMARVPAVAVTQPQAGVRVFDMGVNFAGWFQLQVGGRRGTRVTLRIGEVLNPEGTVSQTTTGSPIFDTYTLSGEGVEKWHPTFAYHGFRYVQATGLPPSSENDAITGIVLRGANEPAGAFSSSSSLLNDIHAMINRSIQSNMMAILTDCPNREKRGWLGDAAVMLGSITRNYDVAAYLRNIVRNIGDSQTAEGLVPTFVPAFYRFAGALGDDPNWGNAIALIPWHLYETYGDIETLKKFYPGMQRYLDYLDGNAKGHMLDAGLGDWETPTRVTPDQSVPPAMTSTYGYYRMAVTLGRIASVLGNSGDAARASGLAAAISEAFNSRYLDRTNHTYLNGQQAADALALDMGIVPEDERQAVLDHLVASIRSAGNHATVGIIGLPALLRVLAAAERDDVIFDIANETTYPSYGYEIASGATTLAETWEMDRTASFNHMMFGSIDEWFTSGLAGIRQAPGSIAYTRLIIKPAILDGLMEVQGTYETPQGLVSSRWIRDGRGVVRLSVTVPGNATAQIRVPAGTSPLRQPRRHASSTAKPETGVVVYDVGPGSYTFVVGPPRRLP